MATSRTEKSALPQFRRRHHTGKRRSRGRFAQGARRRFHQGAIRNSDDAYLAAAAEAHKQGLPIVGHVPTKIRLEETVAAGQKSIEHLMGIFEGCSTEEDKFISGQGDLKLMLTTYDEQGAMRSSPAGEKTDLAGAHFGLAARRNVPRSARPETPAARQVRSRLLARRDLAPIHRGNDAGSFARSARIASGIFRAQSTDGWRDAPRRGAVHGGHRHRARRLHHARLQLARRAGQFRRSRFYAHGVTPDGDEQSREISGTKAPSVRSSRQNRRPGTLERQSSRRIHKTRKSTP